MVRPGTTVAALDLGPVVLARADAVVDDLVLAARRGGLDTDTVLVDTHRMVTGDGSLHVVLTISAPGATDGYLWQVCSAVAGRHDADALVAGRLGTGTAQSVQAARSAIHERVLRIAGRCVYFPGVESLVGTMAAGQIVAASAIEQVVEVGGAVLEPDAEVLTGGRVRPRWEFGTLLLHVQHEGQGLHVPFENARAAAVTP